MIKIKIMIFLNNLPDEIIHFINQKYFSKYCLPKIKRQLCCQCKSINKNTKIENNCIKCQKPVCEICWNGYFMNYHRGWKPFMKHCKECYIEKHKS